MCDAQCGSRSALTRRGFLAESTVAAVGALLAACGDGQLGPTITPDDGATLTVRLSDFPTLERVGVPVRVDANSSNPRALVRTGPGTFVALQLLCTHQGAPLNVQADGFACTLHRARFAADGRPVAGPRGDTGTLGSVSPLKQLPVEVNRAAGVVRIG